MPISIYSKLLILILFSINIFADSPDPVKGKEVMVVSASELASGIGLQILKAGGNAVDAAVAVGFALAVTYPSAGNIGGGGFMVLHFKDGTNITIDYREKAPLSAYKNMFLDSAGNYLPEYSSEGISSAGVPGSVAGLIHALEKYGTMDLEDVIQPAIDLAEDGFVLPDYLAQSFSDSSNMLNKYPSTFKVFYKEDSTAYKEGEIFKQPDLANTLSKIRDGGIKGFYEGEVADLIVKQVNSMGGIISHEDLSKYKPIERAPVSGVYRGYNIISMGPPSSGGIALIQLLNILENYSFTKNDWGSSNYIHTLVEAMKFVYADRAMHLGDSDFYNVPADWLLSKEYAKEIFTKISDKALSSDSIYSGDPPGKESLETTHYSIYDSFGNAVSTTTTLNSSYGNKIVVEGAGFLLNNEMDDFSSKPGEPNQFGLLGSTANSIEPEKRMLSSMTPVIILKDSTPYLIAGSPGGSTIMTVVLQVILNCIDFNMDIQQAIDMPRIHHQWKPDSIYYEPFGLNLDTIDNLKLKGYNFGGSISLGRVEGIMIDNINGIIYGASDPRGHGKAFGY